MIFPWSTNDSSSHCPLVLFHHAGGSRNSYLQLAKDLGDSYAPWLAEFPASIGENAQGGHTIPSIEEWSKSCIRILLDRNPFQPMVLFGHSMGSWLAYEVARGLGHQLKALIVSGASPPDHPNEFLQEIEGQSNESVWKEILGRHWPELQPLLSQDYDPDLIARIRNHLRSMSQYKSGFMNKVQLRCPVLAIGGSEDSLVPKEALEGWSRYTSGSFNMQRFPGGHFYLYGSRTHLLPLLSQYSS